MKKEIRIYRSLDGREPYTIWVKELSDVIGRAQIATRINRVALGNYGDCSPVGDGVFELRIHYGPGLRKAKIYWRDFKERCHE